MIRIASRNAVLSPPHNWRVNGVQVLIGVYQALTTHTSPCYLRITELESKSKSVNLAAYDVYNSNSGLWYQPTIKGN